MKKIIALILAVIMLVTVAACDNGKDGQANSGKTSSASSSRPSSTEDASSKDTASVTASVDSQPATSSASKVSSGQTLYSPSSMIAVSNKPMNPPDFTVGNIQGKAYYNPYIGLKINIPDNWDYLSTSQIAELNNNKSTNELKNTENVYCFMATAKDNKTSALLQYDNMLVSNDKKLTAKEYMETFLPIYCTELKASGAFVSEATKDEVYVGGKHRYVATVKCRVDGIYMEQYITLFPQSEHMGVLIVIGVGSVSKWTATSSIYEYL